MDPEVAKALIKLARAIKRLERGDEDTAWQLADEVEEAGRLASSEEEGRRDG